MVQLRKLYAIFKFQSDRLLGIVKLKALQNPSPAQKVSREGANQKGFRIPTDHFDESLDKLVIKYPAFLQEPLPEMLKREHANLEVGQVFKHRVMAGKASQEVRFQVSLKKQEGGLTALVFRARPELLASFAVESVGVEVQKPRIKVKTGLNSFMK